jgi:hypothetical protein
LCKSCLLKHIIVGKNKEGGRKRSKQILDDLEENTRYWNLKKEALDRTELVVVATDPSQNRL